MTATTTAKTILLSNGEQVRFEINTRDGRNYLWSYTLFELAGSIVADIVRYDYARKEFEQSDLTIDQYVARKYNEEVATFGPGCAINLRAEMAVLAIYSDEEKAIMQARREALPVAKVGDFLKVRGWLYEIVSVNRDEAKLKLVR